MITHSFRFQPFPPDRSFGLANVCLGLVVTGLFMFASGASGEPATQPEASGEEHLDIARQLQDPPELAEAHQQRLEKLRRGVEAAEEPLDKAAAHLAAANWVLSIQSARPAARWLLGFETRDDLKALGKAAGVVEEHLATSRTWLEEDPPAGDQQRHRELRTAAEILESFAALFAVAGLDDEAEHAASSSEAALELAVAREADSPEVAAAAQLWQAYAFYRGGRPERALTTLPEALSRPKRLPYDYFSRLLRCRILAETQQPAASMALVMRIRNATEHWMPGETAEAVQAHRRLAALLELHIGRQWLNELRAQDAAAAAHLEKVLESVEVTLFPGGKPQEVYLLPSVMPIMVEPPANEGIEN